MKYSSEKVINFYWNMWIDSNPSEKKQIEAVNKFQYFDHLDDKIISTYFTSQPAIELYKKLKKMKAIIR